MVSTTIFYFYFHFPFNEELLFPSIHDIVGFLWKDSRQFSKMVKYGQKNSVQRAFKYSAAFLAPFLLKWIVFCTNYIIQIFRMSISCQNLLSFGKLHNVGLPALLPQTKMTLRPKLRILTGIFLSCESPKAPFASKFKYKNCVKSWCSEKLFSQQKWHFFLHIL